MFRLFDHFFGFIKFLCLTLVISGMTLCGQQPQILPLKYQFGDYPVRVRQIKIKAPVVISKEALSEAKKIKKYYKIRNVDFAGKLVFIPLTCGMGCEGGGVVDALSGMAYPLPGGVSDPQDAPPCNYERIEYRIDSRMMILSGDINEAATHPGKLVRHYFVFERGKFRKIGMDVLIWDLNTKEWRSEN